MPMIQKVLLVFDKELRMLLRDRRLVGSVALTSLLFMPLLMGLIGNLERLTGGPEAPVRILAHDVESEVLTVLQALPGLEVVFTAGTQEDDLPALMVLKVGTTYRITYDGTREGAYKAALEVQNALEIHKELRVNERLAVLGLADADVRPYKIEVADLSRPEAQTGQMLGLLVPYLAIILLVTNATRGLFIAIGEKEKRTLSSLLVTRVPRTAIVLGKTLTIMVFAVVSSLLLVTGMLLFARFGFSIGMPDATDDYVLGLSQALELVSNLTCLALLFAALIMLVGTFARSAREAGVYTTPLMYISIFLAVFSLSSARFGEWAYGVPILGNALAMRDTFQAALEGGHLLLAVGGNLVLFALLVVLSVRMYHREEVLFRV
jgi:sodium transport system permease protein